VELEHNLRTNWGLVEPGFTELLSLDLVDDLHFFLQKNATELRSTL
jgi:hypothetical protein